MLSMFRKFNSILQKGIIQSYYKIHQVDQEIFNENLFFSKIYLPNQNELRQQQIVPVYTDMKPA